MQPILAINNIYTNYLHKQSRYLHLWGGSGSGKSVFAAQKCLNRIVYEKPHRILCCRKVANTLRSSVFQLLKDQVSALGFSSQFTIHRSEMRFTHSNGNELLLVGLDDVERLKSVTGITSVWVEEATELLPGDFDQLDLRLRGDSDQYKQVLFSYNPVDENNWIKKRFHDSPVINFDMLRTTFADNEYIDKAYREVLEQKALVNPNLYRVYYQGEWGKEEVKRPYVYNFDSTRTVSNAAVFNPERQVCFSIDFNVEPFICICAHIWNDATGMHYHMFKELVIERNGDIYQMLDLITSTFGPKVLANCLFTGDAMQRKREISQRGNMDAWRIIDNRLRLGRRLMLPRSNPPVRENRYLVNAVCAFHPDFKIHPSCLKLIYDLQYVETDEDGNLLKQNRQRQQQRADALDTFRYQCNTHLRDFYEVMGKFPS